MITHPIAVFLILAVIVWAAVWLESRVALFKALSAALVGILLAMVLSNVGIIPADNKAYDVLINPGISLGIVLILLEVNVKTIRKAGGAMLAAFGLGAVGTAAGAFVSALVLAPLVGPETWKLAGQFTGTYNGGGVNFAALGRAFDTSSELFAAAIAADVLLTALWMAACLMVPLLFRRKQRKKSARPQDGLTQSLYKSKERVALQDTALLVVIALGAVWLSEQLGSIVPVIPEVLWLTTIALAVAQVPQVRRLSGAAMWGYYLLLLFLTTNGAQSVVRNIVAIGPGVLYFAIGTLTLHGIFVFGIGVLFRMDPTTLAIASQANVGGPASAMALATARGATDRVLSGVAVGLLGYAIGNYTGFAIGMLVRGILGY